MSGDLRYALTRALVENGVSISAPSSIHSWRCEYPRQYGLCDCFKRLLDDLVQAAAGARR
ncbi:Uncharacterised protein [Mycobacteroides abscessus subsp. abscessus]|nr:Uncharacterised protein [Mycobacteroides abscessus subsp. abscessus]